MPHGSTKFQATIASLIRLMYMATGLENGVHRVRPLNTRPSVPCAWNIFHLKTLGCLKYSSMLKGKSINRRLVLSLLKLKGILCCLVQMWIKEKIRDLSIYPFKIYHYSWSSLDLEKLLQVTIHLHQKMVHHSCSRRWSHEMCLPTLQWVDGLGPFFWQKCSQDTSKSSFGYTIQYDETGNSQGHKQCDVLVHSWSEEKNEISVRFLKTLFFGHVKGYDVAKKIVDMLEETGFQLPLSGLISLSSDWPNVNKTIWSVINKVLLDQGLPGLLPFIPCNMQGSCVLYCHYLCSPLTHWLLGLFGKNVVFWTFWWFWVWMSAKLVLIWAKMHLQLDN